MEVLEDAVRRPAAAKGLGEALGAERRLVASA